MSFRNTAEIQQKCRSTTKTVSKNIRLAKSYDQNRFPPQIMAISFVFWPNFSPSLRDSQICSYLHDIFVGVHSNIVEWDNPVAVNPQEPFANLSHPSGADASTKIFF
jgi:hypothetical protein